MDYQGAVVISLRTTSGFEMSDETPKEMAGHLQKRKRGSCDELPDEIFVSSATVKRKKGLSATTSWQPSPAGPSTTSASRREPPLEFAPVASTAWGAESGSRRRKPGVETVEFETPPIVEYTPPAVKPTLDEVRAELAARPFEPSRAVAEYLGLNYQTPVSVEQVEKLPRDIQKYVTGSEHLLLTTEDASVWYAAPKSKDVKQADGTRKHVKTCEVIRDIVPNDPRLPDWVSHEVGITDQDTRLQSKCARMCNAMKRNLSHPITRQFLKRLGHQTRKSPSVGGTWE